MGASHRRTDGGGTLLVQAEWYTVLKYRGKGSTASSGRFDIGIPNPEDLEIPDPQPLVAFECGRNKTAEDLLRNVDAAADDKGPKPADIRKCSAKLGVRACPTGTP